MIEPPPRRRSTTAQAATPRPVRPRTAVLLTATVLGGVLLAGCTGNRSTPAAAPSTSRWSVASQPASAATSGSAAAGSGASGPAGSSGPSGASGPAGATGGQDDGSRQRGVPADVTDLPPQQRIHQPPGASTRVRTPQGIWVVSAPEVAGAGDAAASPAGSPAPSSGPSAASSGSSGYGELLLLDPSGSRVLRAYPFRGLAPQWVIVAPDAVYCGRRGTPAAPDAMICRVDRSTGELRVRVLPDGGPSTVTSQNDLAGRPGRWVLDFRNFPVDFGRTPDLTRTELIFRGSGSVTLHIARDTLQVLGS